MKNEEERNQLLHYLHDEKHFLPVKPEFYLVNTVKKNFKNIYSNKSCRPNFHSNFHQKTAKNSLFGGQSAIHL